MNVWFNLFFFSVCIVLWPSELNAKWGITKADAWVINISKDPIDDSIDFLAICQEKYRDDVFLAIKYEEKKGNSIRFILYTNRYVDDTFFFDNKTATREFKIRYDDKKYMITKGIPQGDKIIFNNPNLVVRKLLNHKKMTVQIDHQSRFWSETEDTIGSYQFQLSGIKTVCSLLNKAKNIAKRR